MKKPYALIIAFALCFALSLSVSAAARMKNGIIGSSLQTGCASIYGTINSELFEVDATCANSYAGSGTTWKNINATPADSSTQTAYDFTATAGSAGAPVFTGSVGSSAAYWLMPSGATVGASSFFQITNGNTTALKNITKTTAGQSATIIMALGTPSSLGSSNFSIMGDIGDASTGTGFRTLLTSSAGTIFFYLFNGSGHNSNLGVSLSTSTDYLVALTVNDTGGTLGLAVNANSFTAKILPSATNTNNPDGVFMIGDSGFSGAVGVVNNTKIYGFYMFNAILSDGNLASVVSILNTRHGRTYALLDLRGKTMLAANDDGGR